MEVDVRGFIEPDPTRVVNSSRLWDENAWPEGLSDGDRAYLRARAVAPLVARERKLRTARTFEEVPAPGGNTWWGKTYDSKDSKGNEYRRLGVEDHMAKHGATAMVIPLYAPMTPSAPSTYQLRLNPARKTTDDKGRERSLKFELPSNTERGDRDGTMPADINPMICDAGVEPLVFTEGQAKGDAILSAALTEGLEVVPVTFTGVTMPYLSADNPDNVTGRKVLAPSLKPLPLAGRTVFLCWDADCMTNKSVRDALVTTGTLVEAEGATALVVIVPAVDGDAKAGVDDYLMSRREAGGHPMSDLLKAAMPLAEFERITRTYEHTGVGRMARLVDELETRRTHRYSPVRKSWMYYDGGIWAKDEGNTRATRVSIECARRDPFDTGARSSREPGSVLNLAASNPSLVLSTDAMDADASLFCVANGVVELESGTMLEHSPDLFMSYRSPYNYDPSATAPTWDRIVRFALNDDPETVAWFQRWAGSLLYGTVREELLLVAFGGGSNGKSTIFKALQSAMGTYTTTLKSEFLVGGAKEHDWAELFHRRFVLTTETNDGDMLDSSVLKRLAGRDEIQACRKYEAPFAFVPTHSAALMTNNLPIVRGMDRGTWRRLLCLPFERTITESMKDADIDTKLAMEGEGILAWMVAGAVDYASNGYKVGTCPVVEAAGQRYRSSQDVIGQWLDDCVKVDPTKRVLKSMFYQSYKNWCADEGRKPRSAQGFIKALQERGLLSHDPDEWKRKSGGKEYILGLTLDLSNAEGDDF